MGNHAACMRNACAGREGSTAPAGYPDGFVRGGEEDLNGGITALKAMSVETKALITSQGAGMRKRLGNARKKIEIRPDLDKH